MRVEWLGGPRDGDSIELPDRTQTIELVVKPQPGEPYDREKHDKVFGLVDLIRHPSGKVFAPFYSARKP